MTDLKDEFIDIFVNTYLAVARNVWEKYEADPDNVPKPDFASAAALVVSVGEALKDEAGIDG